MTQSNVHKPRYSFRNRAQSKIWVYKNSYLRRFYERRSRRVKRGGLFRRYVLVAHNRKWTIARRYIRPTRRRSGRRKKFSASTVYGRPAKRLYMKAFSQKQQLRLFYGITKEHAYTSFFRTHRSFQGLSCSSFFSQLESRLDRTLYRRRLFPTIFACRQYIYHHGVLLNNQIETSPRSFVQVGDSIQIPISTWKQLYWDLFCRVYYRRWGQYLFSRRFYSRFKKKIFKARWQSFRFFRSKPQKLKWYNYNSTIHRSNLFTLIGKSISIGKEKNKANIRTHSKKVNKISWTKSFFTQTNKLSSRGTTLLSAIKKLKRSRRINYTPKLNNKRIKLNKKNLNTFKSNSRRLHSRYFSNVNSSQHFFSPIDRFRSSIREKTKMYAETSSHQVNNFFFGPFSAKQTANVKSTFSRRRFSNVSPFYADLSTFLEQRVVAQEQLEQGSLRKNTNNSSFGSARKNKQLLAFFYTQKARKLFLPRYSKRAKFGASTEIDQIRMPKKKFRRYSQKRARSFRRQIRRFIRRWRFYTLRNRKYLRLKPTHLYIPAYLQYDFRTLQMMKVTAPISQQIYTGFRVSPSKMYAYYKSRGFLLLIYFLMSSAINF